MEFQINTSFVPIGLKFKQSACCFNFLPLGRPVWGEFSLLLLVLTFVTLFPLARKAKLADVLTSTRKKKLLLTISQMAVTSVSFGLDGFSMYWWHNCHVAVL